MLTHSTEYSEQFGSWDLTTCSAKLYVSQHLPYGTTLNDVGPCKRHPIPNAVHMGFTGSLGTYETLNINIIEDGVIRIAYKFCFPHSPKYDHVLSLSVPWQLSTCLWQSLRCFGQVESLDWCQKIWNRQNRLLSQIVATWPPELIACIKWKAFWGNYW